MTRVFLQVDLDRTEGKFVGAEELGNELAEGLRNEQVSVEDSEYEVLEVEVVEDPNKKSGGAGKSADKGDLGDILWKLSDAYFDARPIQISFDGPAEDAVRDSLEGPEKALDGVLFSLMLRNDVSQLIQRAKVKDDRRQQAERSAKVKAERQASK